MHQNRLISSNETHVSPLLRCGRELVKTETMQRLPSDTTGVQDLKAHSAGMDRVLAVLLIVLRVVDEDSGDFDPKLKCVVLRTNELPGSTWDAEPFELEDTSGRDCLMKLLNASRLD